jgi:cellulose synthase/poly-beta-1,6-N-acetylglucosamine synthase-like glycosyltransferase
MGNNALLASLSAVLVLLGAALLVVTGYLLVLTLAAVFGRTTHPAPGPSRRRFAILVPAHNEESLIGRLLENLRALNYPTARYRVFVVADNCNDRTAALARALGAAVYERTDHSLQGKGFALRWLLERLRDEGRPFDAYVVLDADSVVRPNFLQCMDARLHAGSQVIQAYYSVLNPGDSPLAALRYTALAALHYVRPLGRSVFGLSCGLKGNGMCFAGPILDRFGWRWFTLAEDVEFHLALVRDGVRVDFAPETSVLADMPVTFRQASSQNARWERGRLQLVREHVPALLAEGVRRRSLLQLDAAAEQLIPPLSVPVALGGACLLASVALGQGVPATLAALSLGGQAAYLLVGLAMVGAPRGAYLALGYAPLYILWKVGLYGRALVTTRAARWVRTARVTPGRAVGAARQGASGTAESR